LPREKKRMPLIKGSPLVEKKRNARGRRAVPFSSKSRGEVYALEEVEDSLCQTRPEAKREKREVTTSAKERGLHAASMAKKEWCLKRSNGKRKKPRRRRSIRKICEPSEASLGMIRP